MPLDNAYIKNFNGKPRDECLNEHWFLNLKHDQDTIEAWESICSVKKSQRQAFLTKF
jgi:hypothetical protein